MWALKVNVGLGVFAVLVALASFTSAAECPSFRVFFSKCRRELPNFDECLVGALNRVKSCYDKGDPSLNIPPFEPLEYGEITKETVTSNVRLPGLFSARVTLPNITEWAWRNSTYTKVKTDFRRKIVQIYQTVPLKQVRSAIGGSGDILGVPFVDRQGDMSLDMIGVKQRFTIQMQPDGKLKVNLIILSVNDLELGSRGLIHDDVGEKIVNAAIKRFWRLGYPIVRAFAYEISDKAKTMLFNKLYNEIDWNTLFDTTF